MIPWFIVSIIDFIAWRFGYQTYVQAQGGPGWHCGRFGAERIYFIRRIPGEPRPKRLRPLHR